jgi:hypothetical protein
MRHRRYHRRRPGGSWIFWIFGSLFVMAILGKAGVMPYIFPFVLFWFFGPMIWGVFGSPESKRRWRKSRHRRPMPPLQIRPAQSRSDRSTPSLQPAKAAAPPLHGLDSLRSRCGACGGPVDGTTIDWRGQIAYCGYCGTRLE